MELTPHRTLNGIDVIIEDNLVTRWRDLTPDAFTMRMLSDSSMSDLLDCWSELATLHWGRPGECGTGCPAILPRQWTIPHLTSAQLFVFEAFIDHDGMTPDVRQRLDVLLPTCEAQAA